MIIYRDLGFRVTPCMTDEGPYVLMRVHVGRAVYGERVWCPREHGMYPRAVTEITDDALDTAWGFVMNHGDLW